MNYHGKSPYYLPLTFLKLSISIQRTIQKSKFFIVGEHVCGIDEMTECNAVANNTPLKDHTYSSRFSYSMILCSTWFSGLRVNVKNRQIT